MRASHFVRAIAGGVGRIGRTQWQRNDVMDLLEELKNLAAKLYSEGIE